MKEINWRKKGKQAVSFALLLWGFFLFGEGLAQWQSTYEDTMTEPEAVLAIVIDDFGYHGEGTEEMIALPVDFTAAVMPFSAQTVQDAQALEAAGREIIIHMPMESNVGKREWVGDKGIFKEMSAQETKDVLEEAFAVLPMAVGMNNHMGSAITTNAEKMQVIAEALAERGMFYLDSVTEANTVCDDCCQKAGVTCLARSVFLDSTDDVETVRKNLLAAAKKAKENGGAVAIGHVGPEGGRVTAQAIWDTYEQIEKMGVRFVTLSEYVQIMGEHTDSSQA